MTGEKAAKTAMTEGSNSLLTLRRILLVTGLLLSGAVTWMLLWTGDTYRNFAIETLNNSVSGTVNFFVGSRVAQDYGDKVTPIVNEWSRLGSLVKSFQENDQTRMKAELNILSNARQVVQGELDLIETVAYDENFTKLATSDSELGASITDDPAVLEYLKNREKAEARKPATYMWSTPDGRPVFSFILPVGGFRAVGFLEVVTDPLPTLAGIGKVLGGNFRIFDTDGTLLFESLEDGQTSEGDEQIAAADGSDGAEPGNTEATPPETANTPDSENASATQRAAVDILISDGRGGTWAKATFDRDITDFYSQTNDLRMLSIEILVAVLVVGWLAGWILLRTTVFRNLRAFARAMTSISNGDTNVDLPKVGSDEIGDMKKALIGLRESVRQAMILQNMVENTPTMTALITPAGTLSYLNASAQDYVGGNTDTVSGDFLNLGDDFQTKLSNPENLPFTEVMQNDRDYLELLAAPVRDKDNVLLGTMLAWNKVTEREESRMAITEMMAEVARVAQSVTEQSEGLLGLASELTSQSENTVAQSGGALDVSREAASNTQNVATAVEELSSSIAEINRQASEASNVTNRAQQEAEESQRNIGSLEKASSEIGSIIDLINDVAHRTKLLSLNATIEAERAGPLGKGFAVVANEVKSLADQTASATGKIGELTAAIQQEVQKAAHSISTVGDVIHQVNDIQSTITQSVDEQRRATGEISENVQRIAAGAGSMDEMIQFVNDGAQSTGKNAHDLNTASHQLSEMARNLSERMRAFSERMKLT
ncbi:HAMP domain-containing methyl-accepting chemotaxis protein [Thalassospira sp. GB04J01]|uniref:methyl-accepting chemotaxis protein n=1 Tax=Thalassospira sp. GB04J01 TaxID=1485225 RepID=UPI001FCB8963|nr:HAMP domain-containing methyl-accepting chemotaxis protein [Thalassospira sp. GB04J01]|tara:strand:- start:56215 stop:58530 length:2316 start_codon:yes stop_codon:yes gene_type:complete